MYNDKKRTFQVLFNKLLQYQHDRNCRPLRNEGQDARVTRTMTFEIWLSYKSVLALFLAKNHTWKFYILHPDRPWTGIKVNSSADPWNECAWRIPLKNYRGLFQRIPVKKAATQCISFVTLQSSGLINEDFSQANIHIYITSS